MNSASTPLFYNFLLCVAHFNAVLNTQNYPKKDSSLLIVTERTVSFNLFPKKYLPIACCSKGEAKNEIRFSVGKISVKADLMQTSKQGIRTQTLCFWYELVVLSRALTGAFGILCVQPAGGIGNPSAALSARSEQSCGWISFPYRGGTRKIMV